MSIDSWQRRTPGATSVTSVGGVAPAPGGGGGRPSSTQRTACGRAEATRGRIRRGGVGRCTPPGGRSAGCCCGRPDRCPRRPRAPAVSPSSCRRATRPRRSRTCSRRCSRSCGRATSSSSSTTTRPTRRRPSPPAHGATVVAAPDLPPGWVGKPHACWIGAAATTAPVLVFLDADVRPGPHLLDGLAAAVAAERRGGVRPAVARRRATRRAGGVLANVVTLMGSGGFTVLGDRLPTDVAFGPVLALSPARRTTRAGGHAHPDVRAQPHRGHRPGPPRRAQPAVHRPSRRLVPHVPARARPAARRVVAHDGRRDRRDPLVGRRRRRGVGLVAGRRAVRRLAGLPAERRAGVGARPAGRSRRAARRRAATRCWSSCSSPSSCGPRGTALGGTTTWKGRVVAVQRRSLTRRAAILPTLASASMRPVGVGDVVEREAPVDHRTQRRRRRTAAAPRRRSGGRSAIFSSTGRDAQHGADPARPAWSSSRPTFDRRRRRRPSGRPGRSCPSAARRRGCDRPPRRRRRRARRRRRRAGRAGEPVAQRRRPSRPGERSSTRSAPSVAAGVGLAAPST